ncbi:MAG: hypothetical protein ACYCT2_07270 [Thermoplasmataceae archaeon]
MNLEQEMQFPDTMGENVLFDHIRTLFIILGIVSVMISGVVMHESTAWSYLFLAYAFFIIFALVRR